MRARCHRVPGPTRRGPAVPTLLLAFAASLAADGCGGVGYIGTTASSFLRHARESDDPNVRYAAFAKLADEGSYSDEEQKVEAARQMVAALESGRESIATQAVICRTLGELGRPEALATVRKAALDDEQIIRVEACRALGKLGNAEDVATLARIMTTDLSRDCRIAAIESLAELNPDDARIGVSLVQGMRNPDPAIRAASYAALREITGEDLGLDVEPWETWAMNAVGGRQKRQRAEDKGQRVKGRGQKTVEGNE